MTNRRYSDIECLVLATMLDPSFKDRFLSNAVDRRNAKELLQSKVEEMVSTSTATTAAEAAEPGEPPEKRQKTEIMKCFDEIIEEAAQEEGTHASSYDSTNSMVDLYLAEPLLPYHSGNAYTWWAENQPRFKPLSNLALRYLSAPPTSERLFSTAGDIYDEKRNRLAPERAETLLFIKTNFHLIC